MSELEGLKSKFRILVEKRQARDLAKKAHENAEKAYREEEAEVYDALEESGLKGSLTFDFGGELGTVSFKRTATTYGQVIDKRAAMESLESEGLRESHVAPDFSKARINELARSREDRGEPMPDGLGSYTRRSVGISYKDD